MRGDMVDHRAKSRAREVAKSVRLFGARIAVRLRKAPRDRLATGFNPEAMRGVAGRPSPRGSRRRVLFACPSTLDRRPACCAVGGAMFGNQFQGRIFVGTSANALPISVDDPLMTNVLDCIFCHCGSTNCETPARLALLRTGEPAKLIEFAPRVLLCEATAYYIALIWCLCSRAPNRLMAGTGATG